MDEMFSADRKVAPLVGALPPQCQRDVDSLHQFVHAVVSRGVPSAAVSPSDFREVLLTGVTGFIGRFFLRDLLRQKADLVVHCLVRADTVEHGHARIRAALQQAEIWEESFASCIRVVVGDVGQARFGLGEAEFNDLCRRVDAVYHLAADINLASSYLAIRKVNTLSIRNVLELCLRQRFKHLFYASTMGVFPQYFFFFRHEFENSRIEHQMQPDLASMKKRFPVGFLGYPWSKLTAEQGLLFAQAAGMPLAIFRLPHTGLSGTGYTPANNIALQGFSAMIDCQMTVGDPSFNMAYDAVDTLSQACTAISMNPQRCFTIYHCCNPRPVHQNLGPADVGIYLSEVSYESFKRACQARGENSPLYGHWALLDHVQKYWFGTHKDRDGLPICDRAFREDCPHPIKWPGMMTVFQNSYDWVNRHRQQWPYPVAESRLDFDCLIARAGRYAECMDVPFERAYPEWLRRGVRQMVQSLNAPETRLLEDKRGVTCYEFSRNLRNIAALAGERRRHPEIEREEITRPVFIVGINRTGTTLLHRLLARDSRFWTLYSYELGEPVLPTGEYATVAWTSADPRRAAVEDMFEATGAREIFSGIHDIEIDEPEEDFPILRLAFASWIVTVRYHVPDYGRWLAATGSQHSYAFHRRTMQHFTWQRRQREPESRKQWLFKMPGHLMELETLLKTYPDALFIQTHREPTQFMGSWNSMVERIRSLASEPRPRHEFGAEQLAFMSNMMDRAVDFRLAHPELEHRWVDVNYFDLVKDPFAVVRSLYERFGWPLEQRAVNDMEEWYLWVTEQRRHEMRHRYALEDYGLTPEAVNAAFKRYRDFLTTRGIRTSRT